MRLAVVGCGDVGSYVARFARLNPRIELIGCADRDIERARRCAGRSTKVYADYRLMLSELRPDALYVALPHDLHLEAVEAAAEHGAHVLSEKPVAQGLEPALRAVKAAGVKLAINYQYRYNYACNRLIRLAGSGAYGRVYYLRCNIPWHREDSYFQAAAWHGSRVRSGGGTLLTQASHAIDVALCASSYREVHAGITERQSWRASGAIRRLRFQGVDVEDFAAATIELGTGPVIQVTSSMAAAVEAPMTIELYAERATLTCTTAPVGRIRIRRTKQGRDIMPEPPDGRAASFSRVGPWGIHPIARSLEAFRKWVVEDVPHLCPAREALPVLAVVDAIYRSAESGGIETVQDWSGTTIK
ncbi:MAG TPA: Gfo/Idh/MocA family oxidoreductase [Spirochaetia bacterium]|nr:Gfo/Idh/MocA family oxidoreductase [Spirochaetia bacterium]